MMGVALMVGLAFAPIAGAMAFLISYDEYSRHYTEKRTPALMALRSGLFAFAFFMILSVGIGFAMPLLAGGE